MNVKNCPLCDSPAEVLDGEDADSSAYVTCTDLTCGCRTGLFPTKALAAERWNTRPECGAAEGREEIARWRDDALEKAAQIVLQWKADPAIAFDIRLLKTSWGAELPSSLSSAEGK